MTEPENRVEEAVSLLTAFLNTVDAEGDADELAEPGSTRVWLLRHGLLEQSGAVDSVALDTLRELRAALRDLAGANHARQPDAGAAERFSAVAGRLPLHAVADAAGDVQLAPGGSGGGRAAAQIVAAVLEAAMGNAWSRVKICPADDCLWAFVDRSKNQSRRWCAMGTCGNRQKIRVYRQRHREKLT